MVKPKLLLDENVTPFAAEFLRGKGYDAKSVLEFRQGARDADILEEVVREGRILVTFNKDFSLFVFYHSKRHCGVLLLRLKKESRDNIVYVLVHTLDQYGDKLKDRFTTVSESSVRIR